MKSSLPLLCSAFLAVAAHAADDIVIADFEGTNYGSWKTTGEAFGPAPARGNLPGQQPVTGFQGGGLVDSFHGGDKAVGTLTSPEFKIERNFINFLIGGGGFAGTTCMNLLVEGKMVRTATGPNTEPGGGEELAAASWDVSAFVAKPAVLQIVDQATEGWGHILVDQIVLADKPTAKPSTSAAPALAALKMRERELAIEKRYLLFPVANTPPKGSKMQRVSVLVDGMPVREFTMALGDQPDWFAQLDVSAWKGKKATVRVDKLAEDAKALDLVTQSDKIWDADKVYSEPLRGQFHFSQKRGWCNDPNGMVFADGEYHLYYQHNPYGCPWGNMHWGHAVSKDMVHWEELPIALYPPKFGDWAFSGGAVVDKDNTSGWKTGTNALIVATFTSTARGECVLYSNDRGRTFQEYEGNPVIKHSGRDPRPLWYAPGKCWVLALYDEFEKGQYISFHTSTDLKTWTFQSRIEGFFECPDLFELPVDGDAKNKKWVLTAASSDYRVGQFDGKAFTPETQKIKGNYGGGFYAAQTFSHDPQGRIVQMGWFQAGTPGMPFNQSMSIPQELKLVSTPDGPRMTRTPVKELESLRAKTHTLAPMTLQPDGPNPLADVQAELVELRAEFEPGDAEAVIFNVRGADIAYNVKKQEIRGGSAPLRDGKMRITIYCDRNGTEIFAADGLVYVPMPFLPKANNLSLGIQARGGSIKINSLQVYELKSAWKSDAK